MEPTTATATVGAAGAAGVAVSHRDVLRRGEATDPLKVSSAFESLVNFTLRFLHFYGFIVSGNSG